MRGRNIQFLIVVIVCVVIGSYFMFVQKSDEENEDYNFETLFSESEKTDIEIIDLNYSELITTSKPKFEIGETYIYHRRDATSNRNLQDAFFEPYDYTTSIRVDRIERINKSNYYVLASNKTSFYSYLYEKDEYGVWQKRESQTPVIFEGCEIGVNADNGTLILITPGYCHVSPRIYQEWMIRLKENIGWKSYILFPEQRQEYGPMGIEEEWDVLGVEKMNGANCFKVKETQKKVYKNKNMIYKLWIYWVDIEKRVLIKMERFEDNVLVETIELKSIE